MKKIFVVLFSTLALVGCMSPRSFVDPGYPKVTYDEIQRLTSPSKLKLITQFQRDGEPFPAADSTLRDNVDRILRASGVVLPVSDEAQGYISITVNNIGEKGAAAKGFGTGLTLGLVGTTVMDAYEMSITITVGKNTFSRQAIKHAIHTAFGNTSTPPGLELVPVNIAFERVLEQMLLSAIKEYQMIGDSKHL